jgi:hypothetical protein
VHVVVTVTASIGHPLLGCSRVEDVPEGTAPRVVFNIKPESLRKHKAGKSVIDRSRFRRPDGPAGFRSVSGGLARSQVASQKTGATALAELLALSRDQDPISRSLGKATGDLLSWLCPENLDPTGPRLSKSEDIERWVQGIVTRWEKQHGPIRKKELLPHEIR